MKEIKLKIELTDPDTVTAVIEKAPKKEVSALLMKTVQDVDKDRIMGKKLALNMVRKHRDLASPSDPTYSFRVVTNTKRTPIRNAINRLITPNDSAPNPGID